MTFDHRSIAAPFESQNSVLVESPLQTQMFFIDSSVRDYQTLIANIDTDTEVHVLQSGDAIAQITQTLLDRSGITGIHLLSHGSAGNVQFGSSSLNLDNLNDYAQQIRSWSNALTEDADILLYGCEVAQGTQGQTFVQQFANLTGADVAASDDLTGNTASGGDTNLEYRIGDLSQTLLLNANWQGTLQVAPILDTSGSPTLPTIAQGTTNPAGTSIRTLIQSTAGITDADLGALKGIAVTSVDNTNGQWQFSTNGGTNWTNFGTVSNTAATLLGPTALYRPTSTGPAAQSWLTYSNLNPGPTPGNATQTISTNGTILDTRANPLTYAGYSNYTPLQTLKNASFPTLDRTQGFSLSFNLQVLSESHTNPDRGFAVILLGSDKQGVELGFQFDGSNGRIFTQTLNAQNQFVGAESVAFNTGAMAAYVLTVQGNTYTLFANGTQVLTGAVRNYTAWGSPDGSPSPYNLNNFVFLGDNTTSAQGSFHINQIGLQTDTRVRFVPNASFTGNAQISFRAWDGTNGSSNGATGVTTATNGGTTAFSSAIETASITVQSSPQSPGWIIEKAADFNKDGKADLLWHNLITGEVAIWQMNGTAVTQSIALSKADGAWRVAGIADFTGDGNVDILWRNGTTNGTSIWQMNGTALGNTLALPVADANWQIKGVADFDGNGADILWYNKQTGNVSIWLMNGRTSPTSVLVDFANLSWNLVGVGQFDTNATPDLLWQHKTSGQFAIWLMNGTRRSSSVPIASLPQGWSFAGLTDMNNDGNSDIVLRNASGGTAVWKMSGAIVTQTITLPSASPTYQLVDFGQFGGDTTADILWYEPNTRTAATWILNANGFDRAIAIPS